MVTLSNYYYIYLKNIALTVMLLKESFSFRDAHYTVHRYVDMFRFDEINLGVE